MTPWGNAIAYENEAVRQYITDAPLVLAYRVST